MNEHDLKSNAYFSFLKRYALWGICSARGFVVPGYSKSLWEPSDLYLPTGAFSP